MSAEQTMNADEASENAEAASEPSSEPSGSAPAPGDSPGDSAGWPPGRLGDDVFLVDCAFMDQAIAEARVAWRAGDVPVGAVVVREGAIIGRGHNRRQLLGDPTAHAEIEALRAASREAGNWRVAGTLYVTQEPCPMCAGALVNARVERLVYGCPNPKAGAVHTLYEIVTDVRLNHRMEVAAGVRARECGDLLRGFFAELRSTRNAPADGEPNTSGSGSIE